MLQKLSPGQVRVAVLLMAFFRIKNLGEETVVRQRPTTQSNMILHDCVWNRYALHFHVRIGS